MPFGSISDDMAQHRKVCHLLSLKGGQAALGLWLLANSWSNRELTDGFVPAYMIGRLGDWKPRHAEALVTAELWHRAEGGYQFHDWEDYNETREQVLQRRAADAIKKGNARAAKRAAKALSRHVSPEDSSEDTPGESPEESPEDGPGESGDDRAGSPAPPSPSPSPSPSPLLASLGGGARAGTVGNEPLSAAAVGAAADRSRDGRETRQVPFHGARPCASEDECVTLVRTRFAARYESARGMTWGSANAPGVEQLGKWLWRNVRANPAAALETMLAGYFADPWAQEHDYPIGTLAKQAGRWLNPPKAKGSAKRGFAEPSPSNEFTPTNLDDLFGPSSAEACK